MGIQDRDYWRKDSGRRISNLGSQGQPAGTVYSDWGGSDKQQKKEHSRWSTRRGIVVNRYAWIVPMFCGFILGSNWDRIKLLGELFYMKYLL